MQQRARQMAAAGVDAVIVQVGAGCAASIHSVALQCRAETSQLRQLLVLASGAPPLGGSQKPYSIICPDPQDLGVVELLRRAAPGLPIHGSTQMSITSPEGAEFARQVRKGVGCLGACSNSPGTRCICDDLYEQAHTCLPCFCCLGLGFIYQLTSLPCLPTPVCSWG